MLFNFNHDILSLYFPLHVWENVGDNLHGMCGDNLIIIYDVNTPKKNGEWLFSAYTVSQENPDEKCLVAELPGFFGRNDLLQNEVLSDNDDAKKLPLVVAVCGPSGSGKTTLCRELEKRRGIPTIVSCTTRPMRPGETDGVEHWFKTPDDIPSPENRLAYTYFGGNHYWADMTDLGDVTTYTIDEQGILDLLDLKNENKIRLLWVQIERPLNNVSQERLSRDADRADAKRKLDERGVKPDIVIINDYPDVDAFVDAEVEEFNDYFTKNAGEI